MGGTTPLHHPAVRPCHPCFVGWPKYLTVTTPTGKWLPINADGTEYRPIAAIPVTRHRRRMIPSPWPATDHA